MKELLRKSLMTILSVVVVLSIFSSCKKEYSAEDVPIPPVVKDHNILLKFKPVVDTNDLEFGTTYRNFFKESYAVTAFKFYIHGIELINTDSNRVFRITADKYFLVDFADSNTAQIKLTVQPYKYNRISFVIGVDSARNVSGAQTGALDPAKGMFWTWNTGYIMAKLEGTSGAASGGRFEYHIGGFSGNDNVIRKPVLLFPFGELIDLKPEKSTEIVVTANANAWFFNPHDVKLSENPVCTTPGPLAKQISENYSKMFTVISVINE
jgi:hypothetical protein